jgi:beta-glucosidase
MKTSKDLTELVRQQSSLVEEQDGFVYRDLNKNGVLDMYEGPRQPLEARVDDLLRQITLAE